VKGRDGRKINRVRQRESRERRKENQRSEAMMKSEKEG
jgi:hypothetical protein